MMRSCLLAIGLLAVTASATHAGSARPPELEGVGLDEHVGARIPLDLTFTEAAGRRVVLGDLFGDGKPVVLVLAYVRCKMLCSLVLRGATEVARAMRLVPGRDYRLITVSLDPAEDAASARIRREQLVDRLGYPGEPDRWSYLVGAERPIRALAESLGFRYRWDPKTEQYAHPAVIFVLTPDGTISRYFQGVQFAPDELETSLRIAAAGRVAPTSIAEAVIDCFRFDPAARAHREAIERYLQIGGGIVTLVLGSSIVWLFLWERRRGRQS